MQILPSLLNDQGLFLPLANLPTDRAKEKSVRKVERFLFRACSLVSHLRTMRTAEEQAVFLASRYYNQIKWPPNKCIGFSSEAVFQAYSQIAPMLSALVDLQNQAIDIIKIALQLSISTPSSMNKLITRSLRKSGLSGLPKEIQIILSDYWDNGGKYIRDLRDVSEHYDDLTGQALIDWSNDPGHLIIQLPDNPETKSPAEFTYEKDLDAYETLHEAILALSGLVSDVCKVAEIPNGEFTRMMFMGHNGILTGQQARTVHLSVDIKSTNVAKDGGRTLVLNAIEFGQEATGPDGNAPAWVRQPKTDDEQSVEQHR